MSVPYDQMPVPEAGLEQSPAEDTEVEKKTKLEKYLDAGNIAYKLIARLENK